MTPFTLRRFVADDAPWLVAQHRAIYTREEGFDATFGNLVERILADFIANHDPDCERGWIAMQGAERVGSIFCVRADPKTANLRLFQLGPKARGKGGGRQLLATCVDFARACGYRTIGLWTHESHRAACALYARSGWRLIDSKPAHSFGVDVVEQHWTRPL